MTLALFRDLKITDLYVRLDGVSPSIYQGQKRGKTRVNALVPEQYNDDIKSIITFIRDHEMNSDGVVHMDGLRMRMSRQHMADGEDWICLRIIKTQIPPLDKLGILPPYITALRDLGHRDGLMLITGATGHGKTTTSVALLIDYLTKHGGVAVTIEDPVEYVLKGHHGEKGFCFQVEVESDDDWADNIKKALRWAPHYIFVGEIRTAKAAEQVLRAATTGHMVITTVHAGSPEEALMGFMHMAEQSMGGGANHILAAGITAVVHQSMTELGPNLRMCVAEHNNMGDPIRACIREGRVGMLTTYIDKFAARIGVGQGR
jgi:twitching motility protein PilT